MNANIQALSRYPGSRNQHQAAGTLQATGLVVRAPGTSPRMEVISVDPPGPGEVRVRVLASGICHTDLLVVRGRAWWPDYPYVLGHEGSGIVESVGAGVDAGLLGEHVLLAWKAPCGGCRFCTADRPWLCSDPPRAGTRLRLDDGTPAAPSLRVGSHASLAVVPAAAAIVLPPDLRPELACLLGCAVLTGIGAVRHTARVTAGQSVAVFGCGGVGLSVVSGARLAGAATIVAVDRLPQRLELARRLGAHHTLEAGETGELGVAERVHELTDGFGVDHAFDAVGQGPVIAEALRCLDSGGTCTLVGTPDVEDVADLPLELAYLKRLSFKVSQYGDVIPARDAPELAALQLAGELDLAALLSSELRPDQAPDGLVELERGRGLRSVIRFGTI